MNLQLIPVLLKDDLYELSHVYVGNNKSRSQALVLEQNFTNVDRYYNTNPEYTLEMEIVFNINMRKTTIINRYILNIILNKYTNRIKINKKLKDTWYITIRHNRNLADELYSLVQFFTSGTKMKLNKII